MNRRAFIRPMMRIAYRLRRMWWRIRKTPVHGVMAVAQVADGRIVLLRHSYVSGWRLPGGGCGRGEHPQSAVLRELREEIGLRHWDHVLWVGSFHHRLSGVPATVDLFRIEAVEFDFRPSLEIEAVALFDPDSLPSDLHGWSRRLIGVSHAPQDAGSS